MAVGIKVEAQGESEYKKALKDITNQLKVMSSEMKLTASEFEKSDDAMENARNVSKNLNKQIDQQVQTIMGLQEALSIAKDVYGENSKETATWQSKLNLARAELNNLNNKLDDNEKNMKDLENATEDLGEELEEGGKKASVFGDVLKANLTSSAIIGGIKALGSAVAAVGKAFVNLGSQAIEGYAELEQLEGGVQKLFGEEMASVVKANANNAFKTAGMTANEYMETVTSFSASLISSLGDDTAKATEYADMAIRDMSDNANTFGTDIGMIQNAYQGFAKGNFTMLDNLKLGYGGTKTEMERLLRDAEAMPEAMGKKFDLNNYADVVEAINLTQQRLKIAGTTAAEASRTISGSLNATKSAWANLVTGLADDSADFSQLVGNLMESIFGTDDETGLVNQLLPRIEAVLKGLVEVIPQVLSTLLPNLLTAGTSLLTTLLTGITSALPQILPTVVQALMTLVQAVVDNLPMILQAGITILVELVKGIGQSLPTLIPTIIEALLLMVTTLIDNIDLIIDAGIELIIGLADGLIDAIPILIEKIPIIIEKLLNAIINNYPKLVKAGGELIGKLALGLVGALGDLLMQIPKIITTIQTGIQNGWSAIKETGKNLVSGIWEGISSRVDWIKNKLTGWVGNVTNFIKKLFGIHSPSRLFKDEIGTNLALGIGEGFGDTMSEVSSDMANAIPTDFDTSINASMNTSTSSGAASYNNMLGAFKQALAEMKIELDDEVAGKFVENTVTNLVYS